MPKQTLALAFVIAIVLSAVLSVWLARTWGPQPIPAVDQSAARIVAYNCTQSGGMFVGGRCECVKDDTYDAATGYCMTAFGSPGGELRETAAKLLELQMLKSQ